GEGEVAGLARVIVLLVGVAGRGVDALNQAVLVEDVERLAVACPDEAVHDADAFLEGEDAMGDAAGGDGVGGWIVLDDDGRAADALDEQREVPEAAAEVRCLDTKHAAARRLVKNAGIGKA